MRLLLGIGAGAVGAVLGMHVWRKLQRAKAPAALGPPPAGMPVTETQLRQKILTRFIPQFRAATASDSRVTQTDVLTKLFGEIAEIKPEYRPWAIDWAVRELAANGVAPDLINAARIKAGI